MTEAGQWAVSAAHSRSSNLSESSAGGIRGVVERAHRALSSPTDVSALAAFRVLFGLLTFVSTTRFLWNGWVDTFFVRPTFFFKYYGFAWVQAWPGWGIYAHHIALAVLSLFIAAGLYYRVATVLFFVGFLHLELLDVSTYLNHYYLVSLLAFLMMFLPAHRAYSLDVRRRPELKADSFPAACLYVLRLQVGIVYFFAGMAKLNPDWLLHAEPLRIWLTARSGLPLIGPWLETPVAWYVASWFGFLFDSTVPFFLSFRKTRPFAYAAVVVFHVATQLLFPIGMFPSIMMISALVFFPPDWPRRLFSRARPSQPAAEARPAYFSLPRPWLAFFGAYFCIQLLFPLRTFLYPGNVRWHEEGMRFSWRVMVREKNGSVTFRVRSKKTGKEWEVHPRRYLAPHQEKEMSVQPDLILQLAHHIALDYERRGYGDVEVRADAVASLNGHPSKRLVNPEVDLAAMNDGFGHASWIASMESR